MYIIIAGCERVGSNLAKKLSEIGHNVVVIDREESNFAQLGNGYNCVALTGLPFDEDVLKEAGIENADALAAVTSDDNINIMVSQIARQLYHVPLVITRANDPQREEVLKVMGLNSICPTTLAVNSFFEKLTDGGDYK
ncbi:hypothetical protein SDC9_86001 [bioreactor metagenome]|uniref:RCK N-terminal domain-containing protein n=1 Tax=bioreactor metagenome TaxID=1076179 RepID=A0A644ZGC2_9ZZZZ|nr:TrkA family potassium uptake protein [Candidatus Metalachnospira sp.]